MKTISLYCLALSALALLPAQAQPVIRTTTGVVNASSGLSGIARGSWFVIYGTGLGPASIAIQSAPPYPAKLAETSVAFTPAAGGTPYAASMYYTVAGQLAGMLPSTAPAGSYNVTVTYNNRTSSPVSVSVVEHNFGFATQTANGQGPAQATYGGYDLNRFASGTLGQWSLHPAKANDSMVLWGTGLGADPASDTNGGSSGDQTASAQVQVMVGGLAPRLPRRDVRQDGLQQRIEGIAKLPGGRSAG